jgi:formylglycine-generating enzyme required for sulfatase activity
MFYAHLIDAKDSKVNGRGSHIRTGVVEGDLPRVSLALSRQLDGPGRRRSAPAPTRSYPAELDIEMVFVEGGTFTMGCVPARDGTCQSSELPAHEVTLSSFYIGKYAITQAQWKAVMGSNPSKFTTDDQLPVESASWEDIANAGGFLEKLNTLTGKKYRLPTEEEWEYAARGGKHKSPYMYSGSDVIDEVGWYSGNSGNSTRPVAQKKPNELGIYDMTGNLWEWVADLARASYSSTTTSSSHVVRGGVWADPNTGTHRIAHRNTSSGTPNRRDRYFGFRVVLPAQ